MGPDFSKDPNAKTTRKMLPVFVGMDRQHAHHVMANVAIEQTAPVNGSAPKVVITIIAEGGHAQLLGDFVAMDEIVGLSFDAIPATPKKES